MRPAYVRTGPGTNAPTRRGVVKKTSIKSSINEIKMTKRKDAKKSIKSYKKNDPYVQAQNIQSVLEINKKLRSVADEQKLTQSLNTLQYGTVEEYKHRLKNRKSLLSSASELNSGYTEFNLSFNFTTSVISNNDLFVTFAVIRYMAGQQDPYVKTLASPATQGYDTNDKEVNFTPANKYSYKYEVFVSANFMGYMATLSDKDKYEFLIKTRADKITLLNTYCAALNPPILTGQGYQGRQGIEDYLCVFSPYTHNVNKVDFMSYANIGRINWEHADGAIGDNDPIIDTNTVYINTRENAGNIQALIDTNTYKFDVFDYYIYKNRVYGLLQNKKENYWVILGPPEGTKDTSFYDIWELTYSATTKYYTAKIKPLVENSYLGPMNNIRIWDVVPNSLLSSKQRKNAHPFMLNLDENVNYQLVKYTIDESKLIQWQCTASTETIKTYGFFKKSGSNVVGTKYNFNLSVQLFLPNQLLHDNVFGEAPVNAGTAKNINWAPNVNDYNTRDHIFLPQVLSGNIINSTNFNYLKFLIPAYQLIPAFRQFDLTGSLIKNDYIIQSSVSILKTYENIANTLVRINILGNIKPKTALKLLNYKTELDKNMIILDRVGGLSIFLREFTDILSMVGIDLLEKLRLIDIAQIKSAIDCLDTISKVYATPPAKEDDIMKSYKDLYAITGKHATLYWGLNEQSKLLTNTSVQDLVIKANAFAKNIKLDRTYEDIVDYMNSIYFVWIHNFIIKKADLYLNFKTYLDTNKQRYGSANGKKIAGQPLSPNETSIINDYESNLNQRNALQSLMDDLCKVIAKFTDHILENWAKKTIDMAWLNELVTVKIPKYVEDEVTNADNKAWIKEWSLYKKFLSNCTPTLYKTTYRKVNTLAQEDLFVDKTGYIGYPIITGQWAGFRPFAGSNYINESDMQIDNQASALDIVLTNNNTTNGTLQIKI